MLRDDLHQLNNLFTKHGAEIRTNDSVRHALDQACRSANAKSMTFLAKHPNDFFSFYYFKDQVLGLTDFFVGDDPEYAAEQLAYYRETFPEAFRSTGQGKQIDAGLVRKISPVVLKEQAMMPEVKFNTIDGHSIALKNQKERFILLDFWASWCTPCIQQLPDLKALRDEFSADSLKIVSISIDRDSSKFVEGMKLHDMNWTHGLDRGGVEQ
ncbi:TlpA family protein disulfide reductase [Sphingobacterium suaedae]|uniref:TlpA family protein disulfide reductase n=1 Tax=Sphingobacterium suaedae TaxID=1686402 RepID=A0ABW5KPF9_9SPHI